MAKSVKGKRFVVKIGRKYGGVDNADTNSGGMIREDLEEQIHFRTVNNYIRVEADALVKRINNAVDRELMRVGGFIGRYMIGVLSPRDGSDLAIIDAPLDSIYVGWKALAVAKGRRKSEPKGGERAYQFFIETGALKSELDARVGPGLVKLNHGFTNKKNSREVSANGTTVKLTPTQGHQKGKPRYHIADVTVDILPGIRTQSLYRAVSGEHSGGAQMTLERRLGLSAGSIRKLTGPYGRHRPLIQPVLQYFLQYRISNAIRNAINSATTTKQLGTGDRR